MTSALTRLTDAELDELEARAKAATPEPWVIEEYGDDERPTLVIHSDGESRVCFMATPGSHGDPEKIESNAQLIIAARSTIARLIAEIREARKK